MDGNEILNVLIGDLEPDRRVLNPRGPIRETADLQAAIRNAGRIHNPLWVRPARDEDGQKIKGKYWIIDGERRWKAAGQLGMETVPVIVKDVDDDEARALILAANQHEDLPAIVMDKEDGVIGGLCVLVSQALKAETNRQVLAAQLGESPDVVSAYDYLSRDITAIQRKVAKGQLAITVYSLIKRAPVALKLYVAERKGSVSANWVREVKKNWASIERDLAEQAAVEDDPDAGLDTSEPAPQDPGPPEPVPPVAFFLNEARMLLEDVTEPLSPTDLFIVDQILAEVTRLKELGEEDHE